jgi:hypothetical protein
MDAKLGDAFIFKLAAAVDARPLHLYGDWKCKRPGAHSALHDLSESTTAQWRRVVKVREAERSAGRSSTNEFKSHFAVRIVRAFDGDLFGFHRAPRSG